MVMAATRSQAARRGDGVAVGCLRNTKFRRSHLVLGKAIRNDGGNGRGDGDAEYQGEDA